MRTTLDVGAGLQLSLEQDEQTLLERVTREVGVVQALVLLQRAMYAVADDHTAPEEQRRLAVEATEHLLEAVRAVETARLSREKRKMRSR